MEHLHKTLEREKWTPLIKVTDFELAASQEINGFLDFVGTLEKDEIMSLMRVYKQAMMNIALALNEPL